MIHMPMSSQLIIYKEIYVFNMTSAIISMHL